MSKVETQKIIVIFMLLIMNIATRRQEVLQYENLSYNVFNIIMLLFLVFGWRWGLEGQYSETVN